MAQEENEKKKESSKDAQEVTLTLSAAQYWGFRLTWQTGGLQLLSVIVNGFADSS